MYLPLGRHLSSPYKLMERFLGGYYTELDRRGCAYVSEEKRNNHHIQREIVCC